MFCHSPTVTAASKGRNDRYPFDSITRTVIHNVTQWTRTPVTPADTGVIGGLTVVLEYPIKGDTKPAPPALWETQIKQFRRIINRSYVDIYPGRQRVFQAIVCNEEYKIFPFKISAWRVNSLSTSSRQAAKAWLAYDTKRKSVQAVEVFPNNAIWIIAPQSKRYLCIFLCCNSVFKSLWRPEVATDGHGCSGQITRGQAITYAVGETVRNAVRIKI